jgi:hypothetical protein
MGHQYTIHSNTPSPGVETLATADVETGLKLWEHQGGQPLGEDVSELESCRDVEYMNVSDGNALADEVEINLNMFGALMLDRVGGEEDGVDVVSVDQSGSWQGPV